MWWASFLEYLADRGSGFDKRAAPAFDSVVLIGGTLSKTASQCNETICHDLGDGAKGIGTPRRQPDKSCPQRLANDAATAVSGVAEYDSHGRGGWLNVGGSIPAAPLLAGVFGVAGSAMKFLYTFGGSCNGYSDRRYARCGGWGSPSSIGAF
jgi:hypothetical protein